MRARGLDARDRPVARAVETQRNAADVDLEASMSRGGVGNVRERARIDECGAEGLCSHSAALRACLGGQFLRSAVPEVRMKPLMMYEHL